MRAVTVHQFQHTAARRRLRDSQLAKNIELLFQHTAAQRWLQNMALPRKLKLMFQHTATRRRLPQIVVRYLDKNKVSTHSRTKAAAYKSCYHNCLYMAAQQQPHEGGCINSPAYILPNKRCSAAAARRRLQNIQFLNQQLIELLSSSRTKAAA